MRHYQDLTKSQVRDKVYAHSKKLTFSPGASFFVYIEFFSLLLQICQVAKKQKTPTGGRYLNNLLIIAAIFCLPLVVPDLVFANIPPEYGQRSDRAIRNRPLKTIKGWMTHYYAPAPGQSRYRHKTYKREIKNCGKGEETASGTRPTKNRTISVNFKVFPQGSVLRITNLKTGKSFIGIAEDTGQTMQEFKDGSWIDNFTGHGEAGLIAAEVGGKQRVLIELLQKPSKHQKMLLAAR